MLLDGADEHALPSHASVASGLVPGPVTALSLCPEGGAAQTVMRQAVLPWAPRRHALYPTGCRAQVRLLLSMHGLVRRRAGLERALPAIPTDLWLLVLAFLVRRADGPGLLPSDTPSGPLAGRTLSVTSAMEASAMSLAAQ